MRVLEPIRNYLYDKQYFISLIPFGIHVFQYQKILVLEEKRIELQMEDFILQIAGDELRVREMNQEEILIGGTINSLELKR